MHFHLIFTDIWAIGNIYKKIFHTEGKVSECCNTSIEEVNIRLITRGVVLKTQDDIWTPEQNEFHPHPVKPYHGRAISAAIKTQPARRLGKGGFSKIPFYLAARDNMAEVGDVVEE